MISAVCIHPEASSLASRHGIDLPLVAILAGCAKCHIVILQGLMLLSPAIDVPRTLLLRIMEMLQGLVLPYFPHWRIVPSPPIHVVTEDPKLVRPLSLSKHTPQQHAFACLPHMLCRTCMPGGKEEGTLRCDELCSAPCKMPGTIFYVTPGLSGTLLHSTQACSACRGKSCWRTRT